LANYIPYEKEIWVPIFLHFRPAPGCHIGPATITAWKPKVLSWWKLNYGVLTSVAAASSLFSPDFTEPGICSFPEFVSLAPCFRHPSLDFSLCSYQRLLNPFRFEVFGYEWSSVLPFSEIIFVFPLVLLVSP
jgi:hypothetical protein